MSSDNQVKTGTFTGAGVAVNLPLGFDADYVRVSNITDGDIVFEWYRGMTDGHALQATNHDTTQRSWITANGVSLYAGEAGASDEDGIAKGITLGTAICENEKLIGWYAIRNR